MSTSTERELTSLLEAFETTAAAEALGEQLDDGAASLSGVQPPCDALVAAWLAGRAPGPLLVVAPRAEAAQRIAADLTSLAPAGRPVRYFPLRGKKDARSHARRLATLDELAGSEPLSPLVVASLASLWQPTLGPEALAERRLTVAVGEELDPEATLERLVASGYERVNMVALRGEVALRGGLIDVYGHDAEQPLRIELFGDEVDSLRRFDPETQVARKTGPDDSPKRATISLVPPGELSTRLEGGPGASLLDHLPAGAPRVVCEPAAIDRLLAGESAAITPGFRTERAEALRAGLRGGPHLELREFGGAESILLETRAPGGLGGDLERAIENLARGAEGRRATYVYCDNTAQRDRMQLLLDEAEQRALATGALRLELGYLSAAVELAGALALIPYHAVFGRGGVAPAPSQVESPRSAPLAPTGQSSVSSREAFFELHPGDYVVHQVHGIGQFSGMIRQRGRDGGEQEYLSIRYADDSELNVPATQADMVCRYVGGGGKKPRLDKLGGRSWTQRKKRVQQALEEVAEELLELQVLRRTSAGFAFPEDDELQAAFEASFVHEETSDQTRAAAEVKADMVKGAPMDRLLVGDVGFGKTEIAIRAAFKASLASKQVALLVPTTVLAMQHLRTFRERLAGFPIRVESLSRFVGARDSREILEATAAGEIDVLIGTHRLLGKDVKFKDLGLVIIDEEQRFGVEHKQTLRRLRALVDVLCLSATPIPRTLHMSLVGVRDVSLLRTPPRGRKAIVTTINTDEGGLLSRGAMLRELARDGQVLYVHNRVKTIEEVAEHVERLVPEARVGIGHGQLPERELEEVMLAFAAGELDVLVATTIVESGLDLPRAGTIIIDRADRFGLSQLHQLRGRVGRANQQAYAMMLVPSHVPSQAARRRLRALAEHDGLGAGFGLAMRDLEIRGAGNLLGKEQSGHIASVGYATFCQLLERAVAERSGERPEPERQTAIDIGLAASLPPEYVPPEAARLELYARIARASDGHQLEAAFLELRDRFGPPPPATERLGRLARLRIAAGRYRVRLLKRTADAVVISGDLPALEDLPGCTALRPVEADSALLLLSPDMTPLQVLERLEALFELRGPGA